MLSANFSIITSLLFDVLSEKDQKKLLTSLMNKDLDSIQKSIQEYQIVQKAKERMHFYLDKAFSTLDKITNLPAKLAFHEAIGKIFHAYL